MGVFPFYKANSQCHQSLKLADPQLKGHLDFWRTARIITEAIFYVLLLSYEHSLRACYERTVSRAIHGGRSRTSTPGWFPSLGFASKAVTQAVDAGNLHAAGSLAEANDLASEALASLRERFVLHTRMHLI